MAGGATLSLTGQSFLNSGTVQVTGAFNMNSGYVQTGGTTTLVGGPPASISAGGSQTVALQGGRLKGAGTVGPDVNNTGGIVAPGASPGILSIASDYSQSAPGTLAVEINGASPGTGYDQLQVGDEVTLAGTLTVDTSGFSPAPDQEFTIIDAPDPPPAPNVTGAFGPVVETGHNYDVAYNPTNVVLAARGWTAPQTLSAAGESATDPQVGIDADGDAVFTWARSDGANERIQARARSAGGVLSAIQTLSGAGQDASDPQVAVDTDGDAVFTWARSDGTNQRIQARARSAGGVLGPVQTLSAAGRDAFQPQVAIDADGDAVVIWRLFDGASQVIQSRARSAAGVLSPINTLTDTGRNAFNPQVAIDDGGNAVFTWERSDGTNQRIETRARTSGGAFSAVQILSAAGRDAFNPQVAVDADGDAVFTWERAVGANQRIQARARTSGGVLSAVDTLSDPGQDAEVPQVAVDDSGNAVFTWECSDGTNQRVQARARAFGGALSVVQTLSDAGQDAEVPQVAVDADGDAVFIWERLDNAGKERIQAATRSAAGVVGVVQTLSSGGQHAQLAQVAVDADGDAAAVWQRFDGANDRVQAAFGPSRGVRQQRGSRRAYPGASAGMHDIAEFLSKHDPFVALEPAELERLAERVEIEYFEAGTTIFRQGEGPPDAMWVLRTGAVELRDGGRVLDLLGEGEPFGHPVDALGPADRLGGAGPRELALLPARGRGRDPAARRPGRAAVGRAGADGPAAAGRRADAEDRRASTSGRRPCGRWFASGRCVCEPGVPLREAAARMEEQGVSSILVDLGDGELGIVTDRDLRSRVVAAGLSAGHPGRRGDDDAGGHRRPRSRRATS